MNRIYPVVLLCAILLLPGCRERKSLLLNRQTEPPAPVVVKVQRASASEGSGTAGYVGTAVSRHTASLVSPVAGTLASLPVREGMRVEKGRVLARVESQSVTSACEAAASRLAQAEDAWKRIQIVKESGTVTEVEYMKVKTLLEEARAADAAARSTRDRCTIRAPFSGVVEKVMLTEGVETFPAEQILRLVDLRSLEVQFPLPENEFSAHSTGEKLRIEIPALNASASGVLSVKGITASPLSHSYMCSVTLRERVPGLMPGMVCKLHFPQGETGQIVVPSSAVMTDMDGRYVWTATGGIVDKRRVTVGGYSGSGIVISEGLDAADLVIVEGGRKVSTGMQVETQF